MIKKTIASLALLIVIGASSQASADVVAPGLDSGTVQELVGIPGGEICDGRGDAACVPGSTVGLTIQCHLPQVPMTGPDGKPTCKTPVFGALPE